VPGSQLKNTAVEANPMVVTGEHDEEPQLAGTSSTIKFYSVPGAARHASVSSSHTVMR